MARRVPLRTLCCRVRENGPEGLHLPDRVLEPADPVAVDDPVELLFPRLFVDRGRVAVFGRVTDDCLLFTFGM